MHATHARLPSTYSASTSLPASGFPADAEAPPAPADGTSAPPLSPPQPASPHTATDATAPSSTRFALIGSPASSPHPTATATGSPKVGGNR
ncbi:hypothetical protein AB0A81_14170 [Streptomyces flaveolus]|uniref:Uncharacterized protein n=1 Tax=Streptomyces flaveolus TaxID=67297 RepID=A0ABV1VJI3_9ACTN